MRRMVWLLCICMFLSACTRQEAEPPSEAVTITVAVPTSDKAVIGKCFDEYKAQSGVDFKIIDVPGDNEAIYRFYVSSSIVDKFNVDVYFMEDKWVKEFAGYGYLEEVALPSDAFIPVVQDAVRYGEKNYAVPLYADAFSEFAKRSSSSDTLLYLEDDVTDYLAGVGSVFRNTGNLRSAVAQYESSARSDNADDFLLGDYGRAKGWLEQYDIMRERHVVEASDISIHIEKDALLRSKVFAIRKGTKYKKEIREVLKFFFQDTAQRSMMESKTAIPVLRSFYERADIYDIAPHIFGMSGMDFTVFNTDEHYVADLKTLGLFMAEPGKSTENKFEIIKKLIN